MLASFWEPSLIISVRNVDNSKEIYMAFLKNAYCCLDVKTPVNTDGVISYNYGTHIFSSSISSTRNILIERNEKKIILQDREDKSFAIWVVRLRKWVQENTL